MAMGVLVPHGYGVLMAMGVTVPHGDGDSQFSVAMGWDTGSGCPHIREVTVGGGVTAVLCSGSDPEAVPDPERRHGQPGRPRQHQMHRLRFGSQSRTRGADGGEYWGAGGGTRGGGRDLGGVG